MPGRRRRSEVGADLEAIGNRIRQVRARATQTNFARVLRISQAQLSKYELGQTAPPLGVLLRVAKLNRKTVDWLLTGQE